ncbi:MAG: hypothetical protein JXR47_05310 [Thiotrichales bacterium]|nr:hypothetical protein [Thiotrichales bacterium]
MDIKTHSHTENPTCHTGVLIVEPLENGHWIIMRLAEYSTVHGWDKPPLAGQRWVYENDITSLLKE